jgi:hypothetical protein
MKKKNATGMSYEREKKPFNTVPVPVRLMYLFISWYCTRHFNIEFKIRPDIRLFRLASYPAGPISGKISIRCTPLQIIKQKHTLPWLDRPALPAPFVWYLRGLDSRLGCPRPGQTFFKN